jgi:hypothetical protein
VAQTWFSSCVGCRRVRSKAKASLPIIVLDPTKLLDACTKITSPARSTTTRFRIAWSRYRYHFQYQPKDSSAIPRTGQQLPRSVYEAANCFLTLSRFSRVPKTLPTVLFPVRHIGTVFAMSSNLPETSSRLKYQVIFDNALAAYKNKTGKDLTSDPLLGRLNSCNSPASVIDLLRQQIPGFGESERNNNRLTKWLNPTVNALYSFSLMIGGTLSLVSLGKFKLVHPSSALSYLFSRHLHQRG